ncbi:uncharacterized protein LOC103573614 [Microplitis demolitor]|uniref:uncharacterized protein LOC103573614 n=1 Tax=Microplitis demolitor TaxID=69319 RepID=UPI0004CD5DCC|nr:uncharacterized protein LOC103573614 [Microplitis demolitor]
MVRLYNVEVPEQNIQHVEQNITVYTNDRVIGSGTLYITKKGLIWISDGSQKGFSFEYYQIVLPEISQDNEPRQLYLSIMVDIDINLINRVLTEVRFVPADVNNLNTMSQIVRECYESFNNRY